MYHSFLRIQMCKKWPILRAINFCALSLCENQWYAKVNGIKVTCKKIKVPYYDECDVSEIIDVNKTSASKECDVCCYWYFLNFNFKFQLNVCNRCHGLLMKYLNFSDVAKVNAKGSHYRCIISLISEDEAINLMQNAELTEEKGTI